jgi:phosphomannomutase
LGGKNNLSKTFKKAKFSAKINNMLKIDHNIFKAYDIRGVYPSQISESTAETIGRAFFKFLKQGPKNKEKLSIVIGRDNRISSFSLSEAFKEGLLKEGAQVIDVGLVSTPVFYFAVWHYNFGGGAQVTASHNPPEFNGFKLVKKTATVVGENTGMKKIKEIALNLQNISEYNYQGKVVKKDVLRDYLKFNLKGIKLSKLKPFKLVLDTGNAVSGVLVKALKKYLPFKIYHLFPELDSTFPNHGLNPLEKKNLKDLQKTVKEKKADLGVIFDGDGDRIVFVDEKGEIIPSDLISALISKIILRKNKGAKIVYNVCLSNVVPETIKENKGQPIVSRIGHTFVKEKMITEKALFGAEYSGHYFHKDHHFCEAPLFVVFKLMEEISRERKPISEIISSFRKYFYSGIINFRVKNKRKKLKEIEERYKNGKISHLDGLRVDFPDYWLNVRPSNTEDLLRVVVEAKIKRLMTDKLREIKKIILKK